MRKENKYLLVVIFVSIVGGVVFFINGKDFIQAKKKENQENIINCLIEKKVNLYISSDCDFCEEQKEIFGEGIRNIRVINCGKKEKWADVCKRRKINAVPMWEFPAAKNFSNFTLSSCSDCKKESDQLYCKDYCYIRSEDKKWIKISGFLNGDKIKEIFECSEK